MGVVPTKTNPLILMSTLGGSGKKLYGQLVELGFLVKSVPSEEMFQAFLEASPDLVLVGIGHESREVEDLAHRIRGTDQGLAIPLYIYGEGEGPNPAEVVSLGGDLYFQVPVDKGFLEDKLGFMRPRERGGFSSRENGAQNGASVEGVAVEVKGTQSDEASHEDAVSKALEMAERLSFSGLDVGGGMALEPPRPKGGETRERSGFEEKWDDPLPRDDDLLGEISQEMGLSSSGPSLPPDLELPSEGLGEELSRAMAKKKVASDTLLEGLEPAKEAPSTDILSGHFRNLPKTSLEEGDPLQEVSPKTPGTDPMAPLFSDRDQGRDATAVADEHGAGEDEEAPDMDIWDALDDEDGPESLSEPGGSDEAGVGVVPSLKAMLPDDFELTHATEELDLDGLDVDSTVPGVESTGLRDLADPTAGAIGLDAPATGFEGTGESWSGDKKERWSQAGGEAKRGEKKGAPKTEKPAGVHDAASFRAGSEAHAPGEVTLPPEPGDLSDEGARQEQGRERSGNTQVLDTQSPLDDRDTVVGHKKGGEFYSLKSRASRDESDTSEGEPPDKEDASQITPPQTPRRGKAGAEKAGPFAAVPIEEEQGSLEQEAPFDLVGRFFNQHAKGWLDIEGEGGAVELFFDGGHPRLARTGSVRLDLASRLQSQARISRGQLQRVRRELEGDQDADVGEVLVHLGYLGAGELDSLRRAHMEALFYEVMGWERGTFSTSRRPAPAERKWLIEKPVAALLLEALRRKDRWRQLLDRLGGRTSWLAHWSQDRLPFLMEGGDLMAEEVQVVEKLVGGMSLMDVEQATRVSVETVVYIAYVAQLLKVAQLGRREERGQTEEISIIGVAVNQRAHEERISSKLEEARTGDYFTVLGLPPRASVYEIEKAHAGMLRNFSEEILPPTLFESKRRELAQIRRAIDEAAAVLTHPRYGRLYRRALEKDLDMEPTD